MLFVRTTKGRINLQSGNSYIISMKMKFQKMKVLKRKLFGPSSEFKNKFMRHLMETLSKKYAKPFMWKFFSNSHGKRVGDGVGGKVKSTVRRKVMSKRKDSLVVQDCESFVQAVKKLLKSASIIHIDRGAIEIYKESQPFNNVLAVKGIFKMHVIEGPGSETKLWRNCTFQKVALPDIHLKPKKASPETESEIVRSVEIEEGQMNKPEKGLIPIPYQKVKEGMWVIVIYKEEKWIRKVVTKCHDQVCVRCLEKPFGIHQPQLLEKEEDSIYFSQVYHTDITPEQTQIDTNGRKGRKWFWHY